MLNRVKHHSILGAFSLTVFILLLSVTLVFGGTTGKIAGVVIDGSTDEPLPGVNLIIQGTTLGAVTDANGYYVILQVPPGTYEIRASFIGYAPVTQQEVVVSADRTVELNYTMRAEALEAAEELVVTAERELIEKDVASTQHIMRFDELAEMPVEELMDAVATSAGVLKFGDEYHFRGSRYEQHISLVDGIRSDIPVNTFAIKEAEVITGAFNAEYGNAQSGVVNTILKDPGESYHGTIRIESGLDGTKHWGPNLYSDDMLERKIFNNREFWEREISGPVTVGVGKEAKTTMEMHPAWWHWQNQLAGAGVVYKDQVTDGQSALNLWKYLHPVWKYGDSPNRSAEVFLSGPIPGIKNLGFILSTKMQQRYSPLPQGDPDFFYDPFDPLESMEAYSKGGENPALLNYNGLAKITYRPSPNQRINIRGFYNYRDIGGTTLGRVYQGGIGVFFMSDRETMVNGPGTGVLGYKYAIPSQMGFSNHDEKKYGGSIDYSHTLSPNTYFEVKIGYDYSKEHGDYHGLSGYPDPDDWYNSEYVRHKDSKYDLEPQGYPRQNIEFWVNTITDEAVELPISFLDVEDWAVTTGTRSPYGFIGPTAQAVAYSFLHSEITRYFFDADLTSQIGRYHQVKLGFQGDFYNHDYYLRRYMPEESNTTVTEYDISPNILSGYIQDKMEFEGMIANLGLRFDYFDAATDYFTDLFEPLSNLKHTKETETTEPPRSIEGAAKAPVKAKFRFSPRLGISFPITETTKFYMNYGHFYQVPSWTVLYHNPIKDHVVDAYGNPNPVVASEEWMRFGNPNLEFEHTVSYEIGLTKSFWNEYLFRFTGYFKDIRDQIHQQRYRSSSRRNAELGDYYLNKDIADSRGFEFMIQKYFRNNFGFRVSYAFAFAKGSSSNVGGRGTTVMYEEPKDAPENVWLVRRPVYLAYDREHQITLNFDFLSPNVGPQIGDISLLGNWRLNILSQFRSGAAFTYPEISNLDNPDPNMINNCRGPWNLNTNLRFSKIIPFARRYRVQLFLDIYNVFNNKWFVTPGGTGYDAASKYMEYGIENINQANGVEMSYQVYRNYQRNIRAGLRFDF